MSLLRLPAVASTAWSGSKPSIAACARRIDAHISLTVVFPLLPVMPTSGSVNLLRQCAARRPSQPGIVGHHQRQWRHRASASAKARSTSAGQPRRSVQPRQGNRVSVEPLTARGNKQLAGPDRPAVAAHLFETGLTAGLSAHGEGRFKQINHHARPSSCCCQPSRGLAHLGDVGIWTTLAFTS